MNETKVFKVPWVMTADKVAEIGFTGMMHGKRIIIPGLMNKLLAFYGRFLPRATLASITRHINQKDGPA